MKSYTDIEQSRKLAEILPLKSTDMYYMETSYNNYTIGILQRMERDMLLKQAEYYKMLPCWSLAALLNLLPNEIITDNRFECHYQIDIRKYDGGDNTTLYQIAYGNNRGLSGSWHDMINTGEKENLIDCCVQMIIKLKEMKFL